MRKLNGLRLQTGMFSHAKTFQWGFRMNKLDLIRASYYYRQSMNFSLSAKERHTYVNALAGLLKSY